MRRKTLCGFFPRDFHQPAAAPQSAPPVPFGPESSEANRVRKRRNSHQSAVFGKAGNGTVVGISELVRAWGLEPQRIAAREPKSRMSTNFIMPAYLSGGVCSRFLSSSAFRRRGRRGTAYPFLIFVCKRLKMLHRRLPRRRSPPKSAPPHPGRRSGGVARRGRLCYDGDSITYYTTVLPPKQQENLQSQRKEDSRHVHSPCRRHS